MRIGALRRLAALGLESNDPELRQAGAAINRAADKRLEKIARLLSTGERGGNNAAIRARYVERDKLLIQLKAAHWPEVEPKRAAREMRNSFDAYRMHLFDGEPEPTHEPAATWFAILRLGMNRPMPRPRRLACILRRIPSNRSIA